MVGIKFKLPFVLILAPIRLFFPCYSGLRHECDIALLTIAAPAHLAPVMANSNFVTCANNHEDRRALCNFQRNAPPRQIGRPGRVQRKSWHDCRPLRTEFLRESLIILHWYYIDEPTAQRLSCQARRAGFP